MTGIGSGKVLDFDLRAAARVVVEENKRVAGLIGINPAARTTLLKPSGTSSLLLNTSSGIHAWHARHYIRRIRVGKREPVYSFFMLKAPTLVEDDIFSSDRAIISFPMRAPEASILRDEPTLDLLERVKRFYTEWIVEGHSSGSNTHNVSATISVKPEEWKEVGEWMWDNRESYNGLSVLPENGGTYRQAPFEECSEEKIREMEREIEKVNLLEMREDEDLVDFVQEISCEGSKCERVWH